MKDKRRIAHALMHKLGALPNKKDVISAYNVESTTELTDDQLDNLITRLKSALDKRHQPSAEVRQWRSNVMVMLNKCGVYADQGDWSRVNKFLLDKRIAGKLLYELNVDEMKQLYRKLKKIADKVREEADNLAYGDICKN